MEKKDEKGGALGRGVYILANDAVYDAVVAFLTSFRRYNPSLPLCVIPFDDEMVRILELRDRFGFTLFSDSGLLQKCDVIGEAFHDRRLGHYRKLAIWAGDFEEFVYVDVDTVALASFDFAFSLLDDWDFLAASGGLPSHRQWVWKDSITRAGVLTDGEIGFSANTGFLLSRRGLLTIEYVHSVLRHGLALKRHMALNCYEQPFLNFLIVTSGRRYSSLTSLARRGTSAFPMEVWAGAGRRVRIVEVGNVHYLVDRRTKRRICQVLFVHWANCWRPNVLEAWVCRVLSRIGLLRFCPIPRLFLPLRSLWRRYRFCS
jgi:hypothetical protein